MKGTPSDAGLLKRTPSDAGLQLVTRHQDIGHRWPELAVGLGVPEAHINRFSMLKGVTELKYWRDGRVDGAETTWEYLLQKVKKLFGDGVETSLKSEIAADPLLTKK